MAEERFDYGNESVNDNSRQGNGTYPDPGNGAYSGPEESLYRAESTYSANHTYNAKSTYTDPADSTERTAGTAQTGSGESGAPRYYSYGRSHSTTASSAAERSGKKGGRALRAVLAVILVFILGAGVGAYASGRTATASLTESSAITRSQGGSEAKTEGTAGDEADAVEENAENDRQEEAFTGGNTINRVESSGNGFSDTSIADMAEEVMPSIVSVYNKYTEKGQFFGRTYTQEAEAAGSGIIIEETEDELLIVTNNHVVEGADSLSVQFIDEENCEAALKGTDVSSDLAVISVSLSDLSAETKEKIAIAELGDSDTLRIGEQAIAIGNALGYGQSLTVGYISALNREITSENGITGTFIQTDAAINPGNSGGALLNAAGQVIGINSNKIGGSEIEGMGFAIPISKAIPIIDSLKLQESRTKVAEEEQGVIGIQGISVTSDVASAYGLPVGVYVEEVIEGSGAAESTLQQGDIITAINGQTITTMESLQQQLTYYAAGTEVTLTIQHPIEGGEYEEREITVTLSKRGDLASYGQSGQRRDQPSEEQDSGGFDDFFGFPFGNFGF